MDTETTVEELWVELYIEKGKTSFDERFSYVKEKIGNGNWSFVRAFVSILDKKGHYCSCSRSVNSYYIFKSEGNILHIGECCVSKMTEDISLCEEDMSLRKNEINEIIATKRKLYDASYTTVYSHKLQRVI